jgi:hypothetical protein
MGRPRTFLGWRPTLIAVGLLLVCSIGVIRLAQRRQLSPASSPSRVQERTEGPSVPPSSAPTVRETPRTRAASRRNTPPKVPPEKDRAAGRVPIRAAEPVVIPGREVAVGGGAAPARSTPAPVPLIPGGLEPVAPLPTTGVTAPPANAEGGGVLSPESAALSRVIGRYQTAYSTRDADAAAAIWPSVDRRALNRAFKRLQDQELDLERCTYAVSSASATARCDGTLRDARRIGDTSPKAEQHTWTIEFVKKGSTWHIVRVSAE